MSEAILQARDLCKTFGALCAVDGVNLEIAPGRVHAIIGPNGAGKTTLINLLSGELRPDAGSIRFRGEEIGGRPPDRIARLGIGRSYQRTNVFPSLSCADNCWLGARPSLGSALRFFPSRRGDRAARARALAALAVVGLERRAEAIAGTLSHGEQRQLEIAMMLAGEPRLLLLDEPLAGMGGEESARLIALLSVLAGEHTTVLIEHDMDAVFALADTLTVMVAGRVLQTGTPEEIRGSPAVRDAYLGIETVIR